MTEPFFNGAFAKLLANSFTIGVANGSQTLSSSVYKDNDAFQVTGAGQSGRIVTVPQIKRVTIWQADPANDEPVTIARGSGSVSIEPGQCVVLVTDGSADGIAASEMTGSVSTLAWQSVAPADSPFQAAAGDHLDIDTATAVVTVMLPANPATFDEVWISNLSGTFAAHALTIDRNGQTIMDIDEDMDVDIDGFEFSLRFDGTTWIIPGATE
jgi:hypothetical protein